MLNSSSRIFGLDLLRALAISLVVFSHCTFLISTESENSIITIIRVIGAVGVDLFFVLSGYLIGGILLKQIKSGKTKFYDLLTFWKRRWLRTLPNYFLVLFLNILLLMFLGKALVDNSWLYIPFLQNFTTEHPDFFTEAWSLSVEEYAYLILPLVLYSAFIVFKRIKETKLFIFITLACIFGLTVFKFFYAATAEITDYKMWSVTFRKVVLYRLDAIYFGFILIYLTNHFAHFFNFYKKHLLIIGILIFGFLHLNIFWFNLLPETHLNFYTFAYLQLVIISLGLMFPYFSSLNYQGKWQRIVKYISTRSYAIYLVNYSLVLLTIQHYIDGVNLSIFYKVILLILYLVVTIGISELIYSKFELPILKFRDKKYSR